MRRTSTTIIGALTFLMATGAALADATPDFLAKAMQISMAEVALGKLAQQNAQSTGVNALAVRLERDHARIGKILAMVAREKGVTVPVSLEAGGGSEVQSLSATKGADFDAAYTAQMVLDHESEVALFTAAAEGGDADMSRLAKLALPTLREDERLAGSFDKLNKLTPDSNVQAVASR
jgi:putative membrane protein